MRLTLLALSALALMFVPFDAGRAQPHSDTEVAPAEDAPAKEEQHRDGSQPESAEESRGATSRLGPVPVYIPPPRGASRVRVGAATRGPRLDYPALVALAPDHVALTTHAQPLLCWFLSDSTDTRIDITLRDERSVHPLLEFTVPADTPPGVHTLRLADHGVTLERERVYLWFVALVPDAESRSNDIVASGAIERIDPDPALLDELAGAPEQDIWRIYARHGIWYEALASLSAQIRRDPGDRASREHRLRLLEQVELDAAAAYDRAALGS